jgi:hypothetical protein
MEHILAINSIITQQIKIKYEFMQNVSDIVNRKVCNQVFNQVFNQVWRRHIEHKLWTRVTTQVRNNLIKLIVKHGDQ